MIIDNKLKQKLKLTELIFLNKKMQLDAPVWVRTKIMLKGLYSEHLEQPVVIHHVITRV